MIMRTRNHLGIPLIAVFFIFAAPAAGRADNLFRLYPEVSLSGYYSDNVLLQTSNKMGDFGGLMIGGFYLDYTSATRYASLHYDTFAQLFAHESKFDRAGEGQYVGATDDEDLSPTTKLRLREYFWRDAPGYVAVATSIQPLQYDTIGAQLLLASDRASANYFNGELYHSWGSNWSSAFNVLQDTVWWPGSNSNTNNTSYDQSIGGSTDYHFPYRIAVGLGYQFYDFMFAYPGQPGEQAHWAFVRAAWQPMEKLYLTGQVGVEISHTQGTSEHAVNPAGEGSLKYTFQRALLTITGGQRPGLATGFVSAVNFRWVNGNLYYDIAPRLTGNVGAGYYESLGNNRSNGQVIYWGLGLSDRVNKWLSIYTRFVELRRTETVASQFFPSGSQYGREAVGNYIIVGLSASVEALSWSWQF